ncbi:glycosyltransferase family 2 protein [Streptomyces sp. NPDC048606]|uniref:glycosyltransferase family 2 protein n=1 Tax=Streptomyces sp. NPDC048606 TaxID=3154726 RepID=UPI003417924E
MSEDLWPPRSLDDPRGPEVDAPPVSAPAGITLIIPTFNEADNVGELLRRLAAALPADPPCEVLFVDDSTDDTPAAIEKAGADCPFPVAVLHRERAVGGLGGAVVEGMARAGYEWIVVMDADLQHPPHLVPELVGEGIRTGADLVVASRHLPGGSRAGLAGGYRVAVSRAATLLAKGLFPRALRGVGDPMSGFFAIRRGAVTGAALAPLGYKILLELAVRCRPRTIAEVPYVFEDRHAGASKSTPREGLRFLAHLAALRCANPLARMIGFGLVGLSGFVPNLAALWLLTHVGVQYLVAEVIANQAGVLWNFWLIETLVFRDRRHHRRRLDRLGRFALLANADLLLRIPLIALFVGRLDMDVLPATALALVTTFVLRFVATEALVYLPRGPRAATTTRS